MTTLEIHASLAFERGIERIMHARQDHLVPLPERSESVPPDTSVRAQLDMLLHRPSMDRRLESALCPRIGSRSLLSPGRFQQALGSALQDLRQAARQCPEASEQTRTLNRAARLLGEESALRELVQMYRSALYQG